MRKPHITRLNSGWHCAGFEGRSPWIAYMIWAIFHNQKRLTQESERLSWAFAR